MSFPRATLPRDRAAVGARELRHRLRRSCCCSWLSTGRFPGLGGAGVRAAARSCSRRSRSGSGVALGVVNVFFRDVAHAGGDRCCSSGSGSRRSSTRSRSLGERCSAGCALNPLTGVVARATRTILLRGAWPRLVAAARCRAVVRCCSRSLLGAVAFRRLVGRDGRLPLMTAMSRSRSRSGKKYKIYPHRWGRLLEWAERRPLRRAPAEWVLRDVSFEVARRRVRSASSA